MNNKSIKIIVVLILIAALSIFFTLFINSNSTGKKTVVKVNQPSTSDVKTISSETDLSKMIDATSIEPKKALYSVGDQLQIQVKVYDKFSNQKINYALLEKCNDSKWTVVQQWSDESKKIYKIHKSGKCSLQINLEDALGNKDAKWLGQYTAD